MGEYYFFRFKAPEAFLAHFTMNATSWDSLANVANRQRESARYSLLFYPGQVNTGEHEDEVHRLFTEVLDFDGDEKEKQLYGLPQKNRYFDFTRTSDGQIIDSSTLFGRDAFFELVFPNCSLKVGDNWEWNDVRHGLWDLTRKYQLLEVKKDKELVAKIKSTVISNPGSLQKIEASETFYFSLARGQILGTFSEGKVTQGPYNRQYIFTKRPKSQFSEKFPDMEKINFIQPLKKNIC
ncbi:hypothetical protein ACFL35_20600 [Candidatus Riflebacteria bacterium]